MRVLIAIFIAVTAWANVSWAEDFDLSSSPKGITPYGDSCAGPYGVIRGHIKIHEAVEALDRYFLVKGLRVEVKDHWSRFILADVYDGQSLVDRVILDRKTGRLRSVY